MSISWPRRCAAITIAGLVLVGSLLSVPPVVIADAAVSAAGRAAPPDQRLVNLAHLDYLSDSVRPAKVPGHSTYRLTEEPSIGVVWVYANHVAGGGYQRTGGGAYDAGTNTYSQGAFDADDIARAAVVYLRQWRATRDDRSRRQAYQLLRGLTYLQTSAGPNAGNVVLWMQPGGTLNPSAIPKDNPDPSDSAASYWLARTIWALGEGYAAFGSADPAFASFLRQRMTLAIGALNREVLVRYGQYHRVDGLKLPAWLISDGADASSEAVLGLAAYVAAGGGSSARTPLAQLAEGIARVRSGAARSWPYGALLPWALSRSDWHAWGAQMPSGLAAAATALGRRDLLGPALSDTAVFTPHLLTASGPDNGWLPAPADESQIAYGADARVQGLLAVSRAVHSPGLRQLAGIAAGWYFGQNPARQPTYDPGTGATDDGVNADGTLNPNSGAESTIHGLLSMQVLDANPDLAAIARASATVLSREGQRTVEAESGALSGPASVVRPASAWTGESQWSGGAYLQLGSGSRVVWALPADNQPRMVQAVVNRVSGRAGASTFSTGGDPIGRVGYGGGGAQGDSPAPGALVALTLAANLPADATELTARTVGDGQLDALLVTPLVSSLVMQGDGHEVALLNSVATTSQHRSVRLPGATASVATAYDSLGRLSAVGFGRSSVDLVVPPGGFGIAVGW